MNLSVLFLYLRVIFKQFIQSPRQWAIYCLLMLFFLFGVLFYSSIAGYRKLFFDSLRGLYPVTFMVNYGKAFPVPDVQFSHSPEVFDPSRSIKFRYNPYSIDRIIMDIGIRAADKQRLSTITGQEYLNDGQQHAWMNLPLANIVKGSSSFDGDSIYLINKKGESIHVIVHDFDFFSNKPWLVLPTSLTERIEIIPNITSIYSDSSMDEEAIKNLYYKHGRFVFLWKDRLPHLSYVLYKITMRFYWIFIFGFFLLVVFLIIGILGDTLSELKKLIILSSRHGVGIWVLRIFFALFIYFYFAGCLFLSHSLFHSIGMKIAVFIPSLHEILTQTALPFSTLYIFVLPIAFVASWLLVRTHLIEAHWIEEV